MFRKLLIIIPLLCCGLAATCQTTVRGTVKNASDQRPVAAASLYLLSALDGTSHFLTQPDSLGKFEFKLTEKAKAVVSIRALGHQSLTISISPDSALVQLQLFMDPVSTQLNQVVITSASTGMTASGNTMVQVGNNKSFTTTQNFLETLKRIPGIIVNGENAISMASGVQPEVFINGRPLQLSGTELISYLQGLSPEKVQSVELISNPSARYDGEYKAILDIRLKRQNELGWAASYTGQVDQNQYTAHYQNLNLNLNRGKLQGFANFNFAGGSTIYRYAAFQHLPNTNFQTTRMLQGNAQQNFGLQTGLDYIPNERNSFGAVLRYYNPLNERKRDGSILSLARGSEETVFHYLNTNPLEYSQRNLALNLSYKLNLKNFQMDILAGRLSVANNQNDDFLNTDAHSGIQLDHWKSDLANRFRIYSGQVDISRRIGEWKTEAGVKLVSSVSSNALRFDVAQKPGGPLLFDARRSNEFQYSEQVQAAYLSFFRSMGKFTISGGLRAEHTRSLSNSITLDSVATSSYLKWLPSISTSYRISTDQDLSLSYSSRLTRPNFSQLNPFRSYFSVLNYWIGNPYLLPSTRNQFKVNYRYKQLLVESSFGTERDVLGRYPMYDRTINEIAFMGANFPKSRFANIIIGFPINIRPWWQLNYQFSGYYFKETVPYLNEVISIGVYNYVTRLNQTFSLPKDISVNLLVNYGSRSGNSLYIIRQAYNFDLGIQKKWLKGKMTTKIGALDIFDTSRQYLVFRRKDLIDNEFYHWFGNQKAQFSLSYNFGSKPYNARKQSASEEESRVR